MHGDSPSFNKISANEQTENSSKQNNPKNKSFSGPWHVLCFLFKAREGNQGKP
jgi:hypothetical protein